MSRPVTYVALTTVPLDGRPHAVTVYVDSSSEIAVNDPTEPVQWQRVTQAAGVSAMRVGTVAQKILGAVCLLLLLLLLLFFTVGALTHNEHAAQSGDRIGINWGYLYLAAPTDSGAHTYMGSVTDARMVFNATGCVRGPLLLKRMLFLYTLK